MIRVLVVDDSALMVRLLSEIINADRNLQVVGNAFHGYEALHKVRSLRPDVVTMDVNMPRMDGIKAVEHIMSSEPTPIVMISSATQKGAATTIQALNLGAIDFVSKPSGDVSVDLAELAKEIRSKIKLASKISVVRTVKQSFSAEHSLPRTAQADTVHPPKNMDFESALRYTLSQRAYDAYRYDKVVAIGCSTGGPHALNEILCKFPMDFNAPILVVQHMPEKFTEKLAEFLNARMQVEVVEAKHGMKLQKRTVYIAPGAYHMQIQPERTIALLTGVASPLISRPSVDLLMQSVAGVFGEHAIGVILTGMGNDGVAGMNAIKDARGTTIAQDEETSLVFGMPKMAIESGCIDSIAPLESIAQEILALVAPAP